MLSVLIPTFNYNITALVSSLNKQLSTCSFPYEIMCFDDCSTEKELIAQNKSISTIKNATYHRLSQNVGRSKIRNKLAAAATYEWLLFLDADVMPVSDDFIQKYIRAIQNNVAVIYGGIRYSAKKPDVTKTLRWHYGNKRETTPVTTRTKKPYATFSTATFFIQKAAFLKIQFNEDIKNYGHEDTLFAFDLKKANFPIYHIDNPILHLGIETNEIFLEKSLIAVEGIYFLKKQNLIDSSSIKLLTFYNKLKKIGLKPFIYQLGKHFEKQIKQNLLGKNPSLKLFDFYRLYYLIKLHHDA